MTACQNSDTPIYHKPIGDSYVKYTTVPVIIKDMINGIHPIHCMFSELWFESDTDRQPIEASVK